MIKNIIENEKFVSPPHANFSKCSMIFFIFNVEKLVAHACTFSQTIILSHKFYVDEFDGTNFIY